MTHKISKIWWKIAIVIGVIFTFLNFLMLIRIVGSSQIEGEMLYLERQKHRLFVYYQSLEKQRIAPDQILRVSVDKVEDQECLTFKVNKNIFEEKQSNLSQFQRQIQQAKKTKFEKISPVFFEQMQDKSLIFTEKILVKNQKILDAITFFENISRPVSCTKIKDKAQNTEFQDKNHLLRIDLEELFYIKNNAIEPVLKIDTLEAGFESVIKEISIDIDNLQETVQNQSASIENLDRELQEIKSKIIQAAKIEDRLNSEISDQKTIQLEFEDGLKKLEIQQRQILRENIVLDDKNIVYIF